VLFIDNHETEVFENDIILDQGMCADQNLKRTVPERFIYVLRRLFFDDPVSRLTFTPMPSSIRRIVL
jgi:hypothetical protein